MNNPTVRMAALVCCILGLEIVHAEDQVTAKQRTPMHPLVERVSGCHEPKIVWHSKRINTSAPECSRVTNNSVTKSTCTERVAMWCDDSFVPDPNHLDKWRQAAQNMPECYTHAVSDGPGMRGILPARCTIASGAQPRPGPGWRPKLLASIVAFRAEHGRVVGSGMALAPNLVLTAYHVMHPEDQNNRPIVVVANYLMDSKENLPALHEEIGFRTTVPPSRQEFDVIASSPREEFDFALLRIHPEELFPAQRFEATKLTRPKIRPKVGDSVGMLAHTANPFFPRGLTASTHGHLVTCSAPSGKCGGLEKYRHYNLQTTPGFSGAPVFTSDMEWVAMHHKGLSVLEPDESIPLGVHMDFARPNRGVDASKIVEAIAKKLKCDDINKYEFPETLKEWFKDSLDGQCNKK